MMMTSDFAKTFFFGDNYVYVSVGVSGFLDGHRTNIFVLFQGTLAEI